ncbi:alkane 1-monooxygenase [Algirhabdus cladophorae]|uniref:alkane 1-monooxygenase n=1 Tax=Algirhabdus cladophorae TaxID=3377108 RepID=UPI003B846A69
MTSLAPIAKFQRALPFWLSLALVPLALIAATQGGWFLLLVPASTWYLFAMIDHFAGLNFENEDPQTPDAQLYWYRLITLIWAPVQFALIFGLLIYATQTNHLSLFEQWALFAGLGVITGTIGINYSHELMHQKPKIERTMADILLAMVLYSHFRSEHLLVHHRYVATPKDPVTARYNEGFFRFFPRVLRQCFWSAFHAEKAMLARKDKPWTDLSNPFFKYWAMQLGFVVLACLVAGWTGLFLFLTQAFIAIWHLELVNYIEHYGLTRKHLGGGKYEHVLPRHSWNASHKASNWLLINLQRHSDHHYKPDRRFPLLQTYTEADAPQLPYGYPVMGVIAMVPPWWRSVMNRRVRKWRDMYYPEITDWKPYTRASNPLPR